MDCLASSRPLRAAPSALRIDGSAPSPGLESRQSRLEVQRDRGKRLRERIVHVARDTATFVGTCVLDGTFTEPGTFDGHPNLVGDRRQQIQFRTCQVPPPSHGEVHDTQGTIPGINGDAGVTP